MQIPNAIIFDLGGVLLNIDYSLTSKAFREIGLNNFDSIYSQFQQSNLFNDFEKGTISSEAFVDVIKGYLPKSVREENIIIAWNAMLLDLPAHRLKLLENLKSQTRTFLLSNTNAIHIPAFLNRIQHDHSGVDFMGHFEKAYFSSDLGLRKPDVEIFEHVLRENKLEAATTVFIDDSPQHVEGAKKAGIQAYLLEKGKDVSSLLTELFPNLLAQFNQHTSR